MPGETQSKSCFVIAPIGEEGSETRERSDQVLHHIIDPAVRECGYEAVRADAISESGLITTQVVQRLVSDDLVIADLTERNPNVFYELAIRHATRKPVVAIIELGEDIPFDVSQSRTIQVNHRNLDSAARCKEQLVEQIRACETNADARFNPISVSVDLMPSERSDDPVERRLAELTAMMQDILLRLDPAKYQPPRSFAGYLFSRIREQGDSMAVGLAQLSTDLQRLAEAENDEVPRSSEEREYILTRSQNKILELRDMAKNIVDILVQIS